MIEGTLENKKNIDKNLLIDNVQFLVVEILGYIQGSGYSNESKYKRADCIMEIAKETLKEIENI